MKKFSLTIVSIIAVSLYSCKKERLNTTYTTSKSSGKVANANVEGTPSLVDTTKSVDFIDPTKPQFGGSVGATTNNLIDTTKRGDVIPGEFIVK